MKSWYQLNVVISYIDIFGEGVYIGNYGMIIFAVGQKREKKNIIFNDWLKKD